MNADRPSIFLSAAEASGDEHAAHLIRAIRRRLPGARFAGVAGEAMAEAGCEVVADLTAKASMLAGPLMDLPYYIRQVRKIQQTIRRMRPDVLVPVDSPALNWHLAAAAQSVGVPVTYYIAPQVWAWAPWRVKKLARLTDRVACILPFEQEYLRRRGVAATYVGHPLFDTLPPRPAEPPDIVDAWWTGQWRVAMLPGSRSGEIRGHTPALLETARAIRSRWPAARCTFTARTKENASAMRRICEPREIDVAVGRTREVLEGSHFAIAASGTVTLEVAHFGVPMVIFYRAALPLRMLYTTAAWWLLRTENFSLVNILAGRRVVPELMPLRGSSRTLAAAAMEFMADPGALIETRRRLIELVDPLRVEPPNSAADNAAELVVRTIEERERRHALR